jgi:hypothetical protein
MRRMSPQIQKRFQRNQQSKSSALNSLRGLKSMTIPQLSLNHGRKLVLAWQV